MNKSLIKILAGILFALSIHTTFVLTMVIGFYDRFFSDSTYYPVYHSARLIQDIIENTPVDEFRQETDYLYTVLNRRINIVPYSDEMIPDRIRQRRSHGKIIYDTSNKGNHAFYAPVHSGKYMVLIDPAFDLYRPYYPASVTIYMLITTSAITIITGYWLVLPIIRRMNALKAVAKKIHRGDLTARIQSHASDLIGIVGTCFNQMADRILALYTTRQNFLEAAVEKVEGTMEQIDGILKKIAYLNDRPKVKSSAQKIDRGIDALEHIIGDLLMREKKRADGYGAARCLVSRSAESFDSTRTTQRNTTSSKCIRTVASLDVNRAGVERQTPQTGKVKFIIRISLCIFTALILNQINLLGSSQIGYKYLQTHPDWFPVHTMATLIQRVVERTSQEELPTRLEALRSSLNRRVDLVSERVSRSFTKTTQQEFNRQMAYGVFNGKKVFCAPVHAGAYVLMIDPALSMFRLRPSMPLHMLMLLFEFILMVFFGVFLSLPVIRNLKKLKGGIDKMRQDDLSARVDIPLNQPVGTIAESFNDMAERIELLLNHQKQLIQAVAHEFRTPLSRIRFHLEMLENAGTPTQIHRQTRNIEEEIDALNLLINEMRLLTGAVTFEEDLELVPIPLYDMLSEIVIYQQKAHLDLTIKLRNHPEDNVSILAEPVYFKRAIQNILSNACRYARQKVNISYKSTKDGEYIDICDDGPGIPEHARKSVFEPFTRIDGSRSRETGGFGLGLSIVRHVLSLHGGSASITANSPLGTKVTTYWPN